jgi:hypothetical protein
VFNVEGTAAGTSTTINGSGGTPPAPDAFVIQAEMVAAGGPRRLGPPYAYYGLFPSRGPAFWGADTTRRATAASSDDDVFGSLS